MNPLQAAIVAAREGQRAEARALLQQALLDNPRSEQAWLWMSAVVETDAERRTCLERILVINPHNQTAQTGLEKLNAGQNGSAEGDRSYLPLSHSVPSPDRQARQVPAPTGTPSPHTMPTLGMDPVLPDARPIRRLAPQPNGMDGVAQLRAAQMQSRPTSTPASTSESDPFMALVLIGGLSITALAGALLLAALWLIGWPL